ncbi:MAG: glycoside hydrolase family 10 protein [Intestinibacillus sp.]
MKHRLRAAALFLSLALFFSMNMNAFAATDASGQELRGVWVASVYNLDYPATATTDASNLRRQADAILDGVQSMGLNTVFLQVRPSSDALYPSEIFPWSKYLTGSQGTAPTEGFDPLRYWIDGAHKRGLRLHAWINPFRITKGKEAEWNALASSNPAKQHPEYVVQYTDGNYYYNPGLPAVRKLVEDGVAEILDKYPDIDGIHLDDYFYPGQNFDDSAAFAQYGSGYSNIADWRRANVNTLVRELDQLIHSKSAALQFGISPSGIWANQSDDPRGSNTRGGNQSYLYAYADTLDWIQEGTVDYICPQLYWYIGQSAADYSVLTQWWSNAVKGSDVKLYIGEAAYKCDDASAGDIWQGSSELMRHLKYCENQSAVAGHIFFRYGSFNEVAGLRAALTSYYASAVPETETPSELTPSKEDLLQSVGYYQTFLLFLQSVLR